MLIYFGESNFGKGQKDPKGRKKGHIFKEVNMHAFSSQPVGVSQQSTAKILTRTRLMTFVLVAISGQTHSRINVFSILKQKRCKKQKNDPKILFNLSLFNPFLRGFFQLKKKTSVCVCVFFPVVLPRSQGRTLKDPIQWDTTEHSDLQISIKYPAFWRVGKVKNFNEKLLCHLSVP